MSKTKGSPRPAQGDETQREQWWEGEDNKRKVVHSYVRVMTALASFSHLTFDIWRFTTICGLGLASTGAVKTGLDDQ